MFSLLPVYYSAYLSTASLKARLLVATDACRYFTSYETDTDTDNRLVNVDSCRENSRTCRVCSAFCGSISEVVQRRGSAASGSALMFVMLGR